MQTYPHVTNMCQTSLKTAETTGLKLKDKSKEKPKNEGIYLVRPDRFELPTF